jgi:MFS family permease
VATGLRGQAQGLMVLVNGGLGTTAGTVLAGWLYQTAVVAGHGGWALFWGVLTAITLLCTLLFATFYRGLKTR